ncbi:hypothetical protein K933_08232 [Candidatus Halobonum tyrrellensis G22]|uniref:Uncharacterized protein n=1 Tax=Candidatus Halobonum tyrrellensis G22 TaxID=1324957 RepID=V4IZ89_9EURY|nr:hypothetical protein K933_08232 [Candidatus Halobonum tyrrellensis G22]
MAALALLLAAVAPAAAVSVTGTDAPDGAEVGSQVTATVTLSELYRNPSLNEWQLAGSTDLTDVTWTVMWYDQTGARVDQQSYDGGNFSGATVTTESDHAEVRVRVSGTVPQVGSYTYEPQPSFTLLSLRQARSGGASNDVVALNATHYTPASREARQALDSAAATIEEAGNPTEAQGTFDSAVSAYNSGNFDNAVTLADRAADEAAAVQRTQRRNQLLLYGAGAVVALAAVVGGGFLLWRSRQDSYDKLG